MIYTIFNEATKSIVTEFKAEHLARHKAEELNMEIYAKKLETSAPGRMPAFPETFTVMEFDVPDDTCPGCVHPSLPCRAIADANVEELETPGIIEPDTIRVGYEGNGSYTVWWMLVYSWGAVQMHRSCKDQEYAKCLLHDLLTEADEPSWMVTAEVHEMVDEALKDWLDKYDSPRPEPLAELAPQWLLDIHNEERYCFLGMGIAIGAILVCLLNAAMRHLL